MKILQLISASTWNGQARTAFNQAECLARRGHDVAVVTHRHWAGEHLVVKAGLTHHAIRMGGILDFLSPVSLAKVLRQAGRCVLHVHTFYGCQLALKARALSDNPDIKIVFTVHDVPDSLTPWLKESLGRADALIVESRWAMGRLYALGYKGIGRVELAVPGTSTVDQVTPLPCQKSAEAPLTFVYHGELTKAKGVDLLIQAFLDISELNVRLLVCGEGRGRFVMPLIRMVRNAHLDDRVEWLGATDDVRAALMRADVGVYPSREPQSFRLALLECMAEGRPVITTTCGSTGEILVSDRCGILVESDSRAALAKAMRQIYADRSNMLRMAETSRSRVVSAFSMARHTDQIEKVYASLWS